jgi:pilus assembly protein FimV
MRSRLASWTILPLLAVPASTWAFGLGDIELQSGFREPLQARIELLSVTPDVLETLRVGLAPAASFERFSTDRPAFLSSIEFTLSRDGAGRNVVLVTSIEPISELFVTMLVEARWSGGVALREYTVLLDLPAPAATAALTATMPERAAESGPVAFGEPPTVAESVPPRASLADAGRPRPAAETPVVALTTPDGEALTHGPVQRAETLWDIAAQYRPANVSMNRAMVAIYQANPQAFGNNMNVLRIGAVLRIPEFGASENLGERSAAAEVQRQTAEWQDDASRQAQRPAPAVNDPRPAAAQPIAAPPTDDAQLVALQAQVGALQADLEEIRRALALRDRQLSELRAQLAAGGTNEAVTSPEITAVDALPVTASAPAPEPSANESAAVLRPPVAPVAAQVVQAAPTGLEERSPVSQITRLLLAVLAVVGAGAMLLAALLFLRRRSDQLVAVSAGGREGLDEDDASGDTCRISAQFAKSLHEDYVVHEQPVNKAVRADDGSSLLAMEAVDASTASPFQSSFAPYEQTSAQLSRELELAPDSLELKLRLAEVFFQWGNAAAFLRVAHEIRSEAGEDQHGIWDKVVIMGKQICPGEALFAEAVAASTAVDLDLEARGSSLLDLDFDDHDLTDIAIDAARIEDPEHDAVEDDALTVRSEAQNTVAPSAPGSSDRDQTAAMPSTLDVGESARTDDSATVTQKRRELQASAPDGESTGLPSEESTLELSGPWLAGGADDGTTRETLLPAEAMFEEGPGGLDESLGPIDDLVTKLDLAKAYLSIGQPELAVPMLEEALEEAVSGPEDARRMLEEALEEAHAAAEATIRSASGGTH